MLSVPSLWCDWKQSSFLGYQSSAQFCSLLEKPLRSSPLLHCCLHHHQQHLHSYYSYPSSNTERNQKLSKRSKQGILMFICLSSKPALGVRVLPVNPAMPLLYIKRWRLNILWNIFNHDIGADAPENIYLFLLSLKCSEKMHLSHLKPAHSFGSGGRGSVCACTKEHSLSNGM